CAILLSTKTCRDPVYRATGATFLLALALRSVVDGAVSDNAKPNSNRRAGINILFSQTATTTTSKCHMGQQQNPRSHNRAPTYQSFACFALPPSLFGPNLFPQSGSTTLVITLQGSTSSPTDHTPQSHLACDNVQQFEEALKCERSNSNTTQPARKKKRTCKGNTT
ncbi:hypothetical protein B0H34DRAFT_715040, partial [Crassisporium funariophilum]